LSLPTSATPASATQPKKGLTSFDQYLTIFDPVFDWYLTSD
jgi:hypothetical protein